MKSERLQKYLARAGTASRREAEGFIVQGRVRVNDKLVTELGTKIDPDKDVVALDGEVLSLGSKHLYLFHKPAGVISTMKDPFKRSCVGDFAADLPQRVFSIGRLDVDAIGLLLLTNDGEYAEQLLHPRYGIERVYWAVVRGVVVEEKTLELLKKGIELDDGPGCAQSAEIVPAARNTRRLFGEISAKDSIIEIRVNVGRKHFVKRLLDGAGHPVRSLCRVSFGAFQLGDLAPGSIREVRSYQQINTKS